MLYGVLGARNMDERASSLPTASAVGRTGDGGNRGPNKLRRLNLNKLRAVTRVRPAGGTGRECFPTLDTRDNSENEPVADVSRSSADPC